MKRMERNQQLSNLNLTHPLKIHLMFQQYRHADQKNRRECEFGSDTDIEVTNERIQAWYDEVRNRYDVLKLFCRKKFYSNDTNLNSIFLILRLKT